MTIVFARHLLFHPLWQLCGHQSKEWRRLHGSVQPESLLQQMLQPCFSAGEEEGEMPLSMTQLSFASSPGASPLRQQAMTAQCLTIHWVANLTTWTMDRT